MKLLNIILSLIIGAFLALVIALYFFSHNWVPFNVEMGVATNIKEEN